LLDGAIENNCCFLQIFRARPIARRALPAISPQRRNKQHFLKTTSPQVNKLQRRKTLMEEIAEFKQIGEFGEARTFGHKQRRSYFIKGRNLLHCSWQLFRGLSGTRENGSGGRVSQLKTDKPNQN